MKYAELGLSNVQIAIANIDKLSFHRRGCRRTHTPFGTVTLYSHSRKNRRIFSVKGSSVLHNGGGWTKTGLRKRLLNLDRKSSENFTQPLTTRQNLV